MTEENGSVQKRITVGLCKESRQNLDYLSKATGQSYSATIRDLLLEEELKQNLKKIIEEKSNISSQLDEETLEDVALGLTILQALAAQFDEQMMHQVAEDSAEMLKRWNNNA